MAQVDAGVAASGTRTLESVWRSSLGSRRANVRLLEVFGYVALLLSAIGLYGVAAFAARARRRELAIRSVLGATRRALIVSLLRRELRPVAIGLAIGLVAALVTAPILFAGAFGVSPNDVGIYSQVAATLLVVAVVATYPPARRAGSESPSEALKA